MHLISTGLLGRLKCTNIDVANLFKGFKAPKKLFLMLFEGKPINKHTREDITGCKTLYLEIKLKEAKFN